MTSPDPLTTARMLPDVDELTHDFWTGGAVGELRIVHCQACGLWLHPPTIMCRRCRSRDVVPEPVSGRGTVFSVTRNHQPWNPDVPVPYVVALVELDEQPGLRLVSNVFGCDPDDIRIGMRVRVRFEDHGTLFVPVFEPDGDAS